MTSFFRFARIALLALLVSLSLLVGVARAHAPQGDAIITNGTVTLGVHPQGHLNVGGGPASCQTRTTFVGVRYNVTGCEATAPGCLCEGFGVSYNESVTGFANESVGGVSNITVLSFLKDATTATSVIQIGQLMVTQAYMPSVSPNLYQDVVTITNTGATAVTDVNYRRVMDWDVEPTAFNEFVTIFEGTATALEESTNDGFAHPSPLQPRCNVVSPCVPGPFTDLGPDDHGALFDFNFGGLAPGQSVTFRIFYGGASTEAEAIAALVAVGAEVYSLGQTSTDPTTGTPNTFIFAFAGVGGRPIGGGACSSDVESEQSDPGQVDSEEDPNEIDEETDPDECPDDDGSDETPDEQPDDLTGPPPVDSIDFLGRFGLGILGIR